MRRAALPVLPHQAAALAGAGRALAEFGDDGGRDCRDAFLGLAKTCTKLGVAFWDYLGSRLRVPGQLGIPSLPSLVRCRGQPA
jgi:hypothetical protein